jgi:hypothetical protein
MKSKTTLRRDVVQSSGFHVGIELELRAPGNSHDDETCSDARYESQRDYLNDLSTEMILRDYLALARNEAASVAPYFDADEWRDDYMRDWSDDGCQGDCGYGDSGSVRDDLANELIRLTGNKSFKVVSDGSIDTDGEQVDAEVCWNYFASKETLRDNKIILDYLSDQSCDFDSSCGLHINLNNYLNVDAKTEIPTDRLNFLFNFVAPSRRNNNYCCTAAISKDHKYSMIYEQGDRLEFRFFSPTLNADKLNHYVTLANVIYRRLAGKNAKLPKKSEAFFMDKMTKLNRVSEEVARESIARVNSLPSYLELAEAVQAEEEERTRAASVPVFDALDYTRVASAIEEGMAV